LSRNPALDALFPDNLRSRSTVECLGSDSVRDGRVKMGIFMVLFIVLLLAWIFSFAVFHIAGGLLHILLVLAVISLIVHFVRGSRTV
jgi:hypothetical protein